MEVIYLTSRGFPGCSKYGEEGEKVGLWKLKYIEDNPNLTNIDKLIISPYGILSPDTITKLDCKKGFCWHSSAGEVELARDVEISNLFGLVALLENKIIDFLLFTTESLAETFKDKGKVHYLPHPVHKMTPKKMKKENIILLFAPPTTKKAIFPQLCAVKLFQKNHPEYVLHTNLGTYREVLDRLEIKYHLHSWVEKEELYDLMARARFAVQCSFSESFNYFVEECYMHYTPVITSKIIDWNPLRSLIVDKIDPKTIAEKMEFTLKYLGADDIYKIAINLWEDMMENRNNKIRETLEKL